MLDWSISYITDDDGNKTAYHSMTNKCTLCVKSVKNNPSIERNLPDKNDVFWIMGKKMGHIALRKGAVSI